MFHTVRLVNHFFRSVAQQDPLPLQIHAKGHNQCPPDADFFVLASVNVMQFVDLQVHFLSFITRKSTVLVDTLPFLQVTVENTSNCVVPEDVELRLVSQSRGVTRAAPSMHKVPRTLKPMQPKEHFTYAVPFRFPRFISQTHVDS